MGERTDHVETPEAIRRILQRLCRDGVPLTLRHEGQVRELELRAEAPERLVLALHPGEGHALDLARGTRVGLELVDRGSRYTATAQVLGTEAQPEPSLLLEPPRILHCQNPSAHWDFAPDPPLPCTYTTHDLQLGEGRLEGLAEGGLELELPHPPGGLRLEVPTRLGFRTEEGQEFTLAAVPEQFRDRGASLRLLPGELPSEFLPWLREHLHAQRLRDLEQFKAEGLSPAPSEAHAPAPPPGPRLLVDHAPRVLLVTPDTALADHMAQALGRRFGLAQLDYLQGPLRPRLAPSGWGEYRLILVHQRLRVDSGLELTRRLVHEEGCPIPILLMGTEEDLALKRNRAIAAGAIDYLPVEPFHVLGIMRAIQAGLELG